MARYSAEMEQKVMAGEDLSPEESTRLQCGMTLMQVSHDRHYGGPVWLRVPWYELWLYQQGSRVFNQDF